jgi:hypothetical protein
MALGGQAEYYECQFVIFVNLSKDISFSWSAASWIMAIE